MTSSIPKSNKPTYWHTNPIFASKEQKGGVFTCSNPFTVHALEHTGVSPASLTYSTSADNNRSEEDPILCDTSAPAAPTNLSHAQEYLNYQSFLSSHRTGLDNLRKRKLLSPPITTQSQSVGTNTISSRDNEAKKLSIQATFSASKGKSSSIDIIGFRQIILPEAVPLHRRQQGGQADNTIANSTIRLLNDRTSFINSTIMSDGLMHRLSYDSMKHFESILLNIISKPVLDPSVTVMYTPLQLTYTQYHGVLEFLQAIRDYKATSVILNEDIKNILMPLCEVLTLSSKDAVWTIYCNPFLINLIAKMIAISKACRQLDCSRNKEVDIPCTINEIQLSPEYMLAKQCTDPIAKKILLTVSPEYLLVAYSMLLQRPIGTITSTAFVSTILNFFLLTIMSIKTSSPDTEYITFDIPTSLLANKTIIINEASRDWFLEAISCVLSAANIRIPGSSDVSIIDQEGADHINMPFEELKALFVHMQQARPKMVLGCSSMYDLPQEIAPTLKRLCEYITSMAHKYPDSVCAKHSNILLQFISIPRLCDGYCKNYKGSIFLHKRHIELLNRVISYALNRMLVPTTPSIFPLSTSMYVGEPNEYNIFGKEELTIIRDHLNSKLRTTQGKNIHIHNAGFIICKMIIESCRKTPAMFSDINFAGQFAAAKWISRNTVFDPVLTKSETFIICNLIGSLLSKFFDT